MDPCSLNLVKAVRAIQEGRLSGESLMRACLERIEARDSVVKAWLAIDPARAIGAAREQDKRRLHQPAGLLGGIPFGVKDVIDTAALPTSYNSALFQGHRPARDAACVAVAQQAGAVLLGKTDTVEFALNGRVAATTHPLNPAHTPGGSSSGSAAAVADRQVPFAFGTQTGGSMIRPASFNGIYAFKPSWGRVSAEGAQLWSASLDTIGWYGRGVADLALVAQAFQLVPAGTDAAVAAPASPGNIRVGLCRSPQWDLIEPAGAAALETAAQRLRGAGVQVADIVLPAVFDGMAAAHKTVMESERSVAFLALDLAHPQRMAARMAQQPVPAAPGTPGTEEALRRAYRTAAQGQAALDGIFEQVDMLLTPAAAGEAPRGLTGTGSPAFNTLWTLLHVPCVAVPCTKGPQGLPVGIQLVGAEQDDARLLALAAQLSALIDVE